MEFPDTEANVIPYPIMLDMTGKRALVVGGGKVGLRKVQSLLEARAVVVVISPVVEPELLRMAEQNIIELELNDFYEDAFDRFAPIRLVYGATNDRNVNERIFKESSARGTPCNIVDTPDLCSFIVPAVVRSGDVLAAISTGGASPALAKRIRKDLEKVLGPEYGKMARIMARIRAETIAMGKGPHENKKIFTAIVESELLDHLRDGNSAGARETLRSLVPADMDWDSIISGAEAPSPQEG